MSCSPLGGLSPCVPGFLVSQAAFLVPAEEELAFFSLEKSEKAGGEAEESLEELFAPLCGPLPVLVGGSSPFGEGRPPSGETSTRAAQEGFSCAHTLEEGLPESDLEPANQGLFLELFPEGSFQTEAESQARSSLSQVTALAPNLRQASLEKALGVSQGGDKSLASASAEVGSPPPEAPQAQASLPSLLSPVPPGGASMEMSCSHMGETIPGSPPAKLPELTSLLEQVSGHFRLFPPATGEGSVPSLKIHLEPKHLGALEVQVHFEGDQVKLSFKGEPLTLDLLQRHTVQLAEKLHDQGFQVQEEHITFGPPSDFQRPSDERARHFFDGQEEGGTVLGAAPYLRKPVLSVPPRTPEGRVNLLIGDSR